MKGYIGNIEDETKKNDNFRKVLFTGKNSQLVVMSIAPGEDIGEEVHHNIDQFIRIEEGSAKFVLDGEETEAEDDWAVVVPAGTMHNVINTGETPLKVYTIYSPPEHADGTVHKTRKDAMEDEHDHH